MFNRKNNFKEINQDEILDIIKKEKNGLNFLEIVKKLNIHPSKNNALSSLLRKLIFEDKLELTKDQRYSPIFYLKNVINQVSITNKRLGFIDFEDTQAKIKSAILFPFQLKNILNGDLVEAKIFYYFSDKGDILYKAKIIKLLEHKKKKIIGILTKNENNKFIFEAINDKDKASFEIINDFYIPKNITSKDVVEAEVFAPNSAAVILKFNKIIDKIDNFDYPFKKIFVENEINLEFPKEVNEASKNLPKTVNTKDFENRIDLRNLVTVTIDGLDTKDFDDAISCYKLDNGNTKLFIHIADVSYYVKEDDLIDKEALKRGTSIYLPDKVIPMLPFDLSNGICSLNPNVDRCTMTLELEIDKNGNNIDKKIYNSIINSNHRLTYNEVNDYFDKKITLTPEVSKLLEDAREISKIIRKNKLLEGYVNFEIKEPKIIMQNNVVIDIKIKEEGESENMIEDFMVRANETIAKMMYDKHIPSIYRIHDKPSDEKLFELQDLINFAKIKNIKVPFDGKPLSFAKMVEEIKKLKFDEYIKGMLLRTMQKAIYSSNNIGHFGLASKYYSHFTSPIRRYPDLLLHRLIKNYLLTNKELSNLEYEELTKKIEDIAKLNSASEKIALNVERDIVDIRKTEFFEKLQGKVFNATLVSIEKFGIFLNIEQYQTSVLIHFDEVDDEVTKISNFEAKGKKYHFKVGNNYDIQIIGIERIKGNINAKLC